MSLKNRISRFWRLYAEAQYDAILEEADELGPLDPDAPGAEEILYLWGLAFWGAGRLSEAESRLRDALKVNSRSAAAHIQLANILDEREMFEFAERHYQRAVELAPESPRARVDWGIMLCRSEQFERALDKFAEAERLGADDANLHLYWGLSLEGLSALQDAAARLESYVERGGEEPFALARLGIVFSDLNRHSEAEELLRRAYDMDPDDPSTVFCLALALKRIGKLEESRNLALELLETEGDSAESWGLLGDIEFARGETDAAVGHYRRSLELNPRESNTLSGMAWIHYNRGRRADAERAGREALICDPGNASALDLIRALRPRQTRLGRYAVDLRGELATGERFCKAIDCLAADTDEAESMIRDIQRLFRGESWWEISDFEFVETVADEHPGVIWISDYDFVERPAAG